MLNQTEILYKLEAMGVRPADIQRALDLPSSRVADIRKGRRRLTLDEAITLVDKFDLDGERGPAAPPFTLPAARLAVHHFARSIGVEVTEDEVAELAADLKAFVSFCATPQVAEQIHLLETALDAMRLRRQGQSEGSEAPRRTTNH